MRSQTSSFGASEMTVSRIPMRVNSMSVRETFG